VNVVSLGRILKDIFETGKALDLLSENLVNRITSAICSVMSVCMAR
jgi:hypothetical protein